MSQIIFVPPGFTQVHSHQVMPGSAYQSMTSPENMIYDPMTPYLRWFGIDLKNDPSPGYHYSLSLIGSKMFVHSDIEEWVRTNCERPVLVQFMEYGGYSDVVNMVFTEGVARRLQFEQWFNCLPPKQYRFEINQKFKFEDVAPFFANYLGIYEVSGRFIHIKSQHDASKFQLQYADFLVFA